MVENDALLQFIRMQQRDLNLKITNNNFKNIHHRTKYYKIKNRVDSFIEDDKYYNRFIVMPGLRGVGKSTVLYQIYDYLINEKSINMNNILYLDVDELTASFNTDINSVFNVFLEYYHNTIPSALNDKIFLLIDEAQYDTNWVRFAKILFDKTENIFMLFTGSSALELESNTDATRRMQIERIYPMNFREYLLLNHNIRINRNNVKNLLLNCNDENIEKAFLFEKEAYEKLLKLSNDPSLELKKYIQSHAFPFSINQDVHDIYNEIEEVTRKIITDDLTVFRSYSKVPVQTISQIITYIATKKPGKTKYSTIAQSTEISANTVKEILDTLELTQLIFSMPAFGSGGKILRNSREHFFITPNVKSSINYRLGRYDVNEEKCYSVLVENMVASNLYYLTKEISSSIGLFYDSDKKGVDFIIKYEDNVVPVEVGIGRKTKSQLTIALNKYNSTYGILVSNRTSCIKFENNILYIPLLTFALLI